MLTETIRRIDAVSRGIYGNRRMHAELVLGRGPSTGRHELELLMHRAAPAGGTGRSRSRRCKPDTVSADLVDRKFAREGSDRLWATNITEHHTKAAKVYCAVVLDVFSRRVVGWSVDSLPTVMLTTNALSMAIQNRAPVAGTVIHSDHRMQLGSWAFIQRAKESG